MRDEAPHNRRAPDQADAGDRLRNGLAALAGTWSADEEEAFDRAVEPTQEIDEELWR
jgi:hypothetical protein